MNVLCVEDDFLSRTLFFEIFSSTPSIHVTCFSAGKEATDFLRQNSTDLVVCDIRLPDMRGDDLLALWKQEHLVDHIPAIAVTALAMDTEIKSLYQRGFNYVLTKPLDIQQCRHLIQEEFFVDA